MEQSLHYDFFFGKKFVPAAPKKAEKSHVNEQHICLMPLRVTKDIQLSMLQFQIVHHILPTNAKLNRFGIKEHDRCHLRAEEQTLIYIYS